MAYICPQFPPKTQPLKGLRYSAGTMGEVGRWDANLFERYRAALGTGEETALVAELVRVHTPLLTKLTKQWLRHPWCGGAQRLEWGDALSAAHVAFVRALPSYDPELGTLATFLRKKVLFELQRAIQQTAVVMRGIRKQPPDVEYFESDDELADGQSASKTGLCEAIEEFVDAHFRFEADARIAASAVVGRYESVFIARVAKGGAAAYSSRRAALEIAREQTAPRGALTRALIRRGATHGTVRVPWAPAPVRGFAGVRLQNDAGTMTPAGGRK